MELERAALSDSYFVDRHLYPNVDFYSGIVLRALGIPVEMYTVLFAMARTVGWVAQWQEMISEPVPRITRPRQVSSARPLGRSRQRNFTCRITACPPLDVYGRHCLNPPWLPPPLLLSVQIYTGHLDRSFVPEDERLEPEGSPAASASPPSRGPCPGWPRRLVSSHVMRSVR